MNDTKIIRHLDEFGRIVIPTMIRERLGLSKGSPMEVIELEDGVLFKPCDEED